MNTRWPREERHADDQREPRWLIRRRRLKLSSPASSANSAIDVYEQEASPFFKDLSSTVIPDDVIQRRVPLPNVILTGHQAFFTREAPRTILDTTVADISDFAAGRPLENKFRR